MIGFIEAAGAFFVRACAIRVGVAGAIASLCFGTGCFVPLGIADGCSRDEQCDDGVFCNGVESCLIVFCVPGDPPCPVANTCESCDEENDVCLVTCADDAECDDDDACTADECVECICVSRSRVCGDGLSCQPSTGLCVDAEGIDVCTGTYGCDPDSMSDYETTLDHEFSLTGCGEDTPEGWQVGGHCDDGTLFVSVSSGLHGEVRYFDAETGAFLAYVFLSDSIGCDCFGVYYCPSFVTCAGAVVTDVRCGTRFSVGDPIDLPKKQNWYENESWEYCAQ